MEESEDEGEGEWKDRGEHGEFALVPVVGG